MLQACLNGGRAGPGVPVTPAGAARAAADARAAGAEEFHVHPRDAAGAETLLPADMTQWLDAIRAAAPGCPVGVSTGAWIAPGGRARLDHISAWAVVPDYASVNLGEEDAPEMIALLAAKDVAVEAGIWSLEDAQRFLREIDPGRCVRILVEMPDTEPAAALAQARAVLALLEEAGNRLPVLLHGLDASAWACIAMAGELGLDTRVGMEDVTRLPDGMPARGNAELVAAAKTVLARSSGGSA